jgi:hypothetical protein
MKELVNTHTNGLSSNGEISRIKNKALQENIGNDYYLKQMLVLIMSSIKYKSVSTFWEKNTRQSWFLYHIYGKRNSRKLLLHTCSSFTRQPWHSKWKNATIVRTDRTSSIPQYKLPWGQARKLIHGLLALKDVEVISWKSSKYAQSLGFDSRTVDA